MRLQELIAEFNRAKNAERAYGSMVARGVPSDAAAEFVFKEHYTPFNNHAQPTASPGKTVLVPSARRQPA